MHPIAGRRRSTHILTSHVVISLAVAAGLSLVPIAQATAQNIDRQGHEGHRGQPERHGHSGKKTASGTGNADAGTHHAGHAGHGASASDTPSVAEFKAAHASMMRGMSAAYTGDPDVDFRIQMIPHHQGAIDMAQVAMHRAKDPWTRQLAEAVIVEQQREIVEMQAWLARRGIASPQVAGSRHVITASSYRQHDEEAGTRNEAIGKSWAPGAGIPAQR